MAKKKQVETTEAVPEPLDAFVKPDLTGHDLLVPKRWDMPKFIDKAILLFPEMGPMIPRGNALAALVDHFLEADPTASFELRTGSHCRHVPECAPNFSPDNTFDPEQPANGILGGTWHSGLHDNRTVKVVFTLMGDESIPPTSFEIRKLP